MLNVVPLTKRPDLAETCAAWDFAEWGCMEDGVTLDDTLKDYKTKRAEKELPATWVALNDGKAVGSVRLRYNDHADRPDLNPWLGSLYVHPLYRKQGVGQALCRTVTGEALNGYGFKTLYLYTPDADEFYERMGWRTIGKVRDPRGFHAEGESLMQINLAG
jgi:predicted N-acetyltransferase YhbS